MSDSQFTIHARTPDYTIVSCGRCLCQIAHGELGVPAWEAAASVAQKMAEEFPGGVLVLTIIEHVSTTPDQASRAKAGEYARKFELVLAKSAVVVECDGFRAAFVRSVMTGIAALKRKTYPRRVFDHVADAAIWLSQSTGPVIDPAAFVSSLEQFRQRLPRRSVVA